VTRCGRSVVVDSDVLQSAGAFGKATERPGLCRDFLSTFLNRTDLCVVKTAAIATEWRNHWSRFSRTWYRSMEARKRVSRPQIHPRMTRIRDELEAGAVTEPKRLAIAKDLHLIEAALASDSLISSLDDKARTAFVDSCAHSTHVEEIVWVNPERANDHPSEWLLAGAPYERARTLGEAHRSQVPPKNIRPRR
jgi:hypothetical protein